MIFWHTLSPQEHVVPSIPADYKQARNEEFQPGSGEFSWWHLQMHRHWRYFCICVCIASLTGLQAFQQRAYTAVRLKAA